MTSDEYDENRWPDWREIGEARMAAWREFEAGFRRSQKGNLCRQFEGLTVTVFRRPDDTFGWCIADGDDVRFSPGGYEDEGSAMYALGEELGL
jgi:hypothetical protein